MESGLQKRIWKLFKSRYLRRAEAVSTEEQMDARLQHKLEKVKSRAPEGGKLMNLATEAKNLWQQRSHLSKLDVVYLAAGLLYFISPLDAVPDVVPGVGYADDVLVLTAIVAMVAKGLAQVSRAGKERVDRWIDERTDAVLDKVDGATDRAVNNSVWATVIGLWGTTTAAAISLSLTAASGRVPLEWATYVALSAACVLACNLTSLLYFWRQYRSLDKDWQRTIRQVAASKLTATHVAAVSLPITVLLSLGVGRVLLA